jgi:hypothetical protein
MSGIMHKLAGSRCGKPNDRGAVAALVSLLLASGVLLGMGAIVVDLGQLYAERQELQSGADASALSLAATCAQGSCDHSSASGFANSNASDGKTRVDNVCGNGPGLSDCIDPVGNLSDCRGARPATGKYVEVHAITLTAADKTLFPPTFAGALMGSGYKGETVTSCARARWGSPKFVLRALGLAISECALSQALGDPPAYSHPPPYSLFEPGEKLIRVRNGGCGEGPGGMGNLAWLDKTQGCTKKVDSSTPTPGVPADDIDFSWETLGCTLAGALTASFDFHTVFILPVFSKGTKTNGHHADYTITGFAAFHFTSMGIPIAGISFWSQSSILPCWLKAFTWCVEGYFSRASVPGGIGDGPDYGTQAVELNG